jgi:Glycosyl hydrolase family 20, catalytic domain/Glycosyl hydrolase family 20, domain 2
MIGTALLLLSTVSATAADESPYARVLLPQPQQVETLPGSCPMDAVRRGWHLAGESQEARERLQKHLVEALERVARGVKPALLAKEAPLYRLDTGLADSALDSLPKKHRDEGYVLTVTETGVAVEAATERGLFYGLMTLEQLLNAAVVWKKESLPCLRIVDWPALSMRGPHEDYGRDQLPTMDDHKRSIRTAARFKANTYYWFIEPDHFVYAFDPDISTEYDRFTFDEIRELVAYARGYYVEIIPVVEMLGHMEMTLRHERYRHLSETGKGGSTLCPTSDEAFEFVRDMIDEIAPAFGARYFHCGLDESVAIGEGQSADEVKEKGIEAVYADYYTRVNDAVKAHGQTMIMYTDIVLNHPETLDLLPKDIVMMYWGYTPRPNYKGLDKVAESGYPTLALSGMWDWNNFYPMYPLGFGNMETLAAQAVDVGAMGHCVSSWGDGFRGAAGINLSELNAYGFAYCDAVSWRPEPIPFEEFSPAFSLSFFGTAAPELSEALSRLARCQGDTPPRSQQARILFHSVPKEAVVTTAGADADTMAWWANLKQESESAHGLLEKLNTPRNNDYLESIDLAARILACAADMALAYHDIGQAMSEEPFDAARYSAQLRALETRHRALWDEYRRVWLATNRPLNLNRIGPLWTGVSDALGKLAQEMTAGAWPEK